MTVRHTGSGLLIAEAAFFPSGKTVLASDQFAASDTTSVQAFRTDTGKLWNLALATATTWKLSNSGGGLSPGVNAAANGINTSCGAGDVIISADFVYRGDEGFTFRVASNSSNANALVCKIESGTTPHLYSWTSAGGFVSIASSTIGTLTSGSTYHFDMVCLGTALSMYVNGTQVLSATSSTNQTNTYHGLYSSNTNAVITNFKVTGA